jgi:hypothetical protein
VHLSYYNLEYISHRIIILIQLWRGFYFSEDILSDIHTKHVSYRRTESRWMACTTRYLSHRHMILLCVAKKGDFTSGASPLCLGRAHKFQRTVGHTPREGGQAKLNLSKAVIARSAQPENGRSASGFFYERQLFFLIACVQGTSSPLRTCQQRWRSHLSWPVWYYMVSFS